MLTDEEKLVIAKQRYQEFMNRTRSTEPVPDQQYRALVFHVNGTNTDDFYWYDHPITPTAMYRWIKSYNSSKRPRVLWINKVILEDEMYNQLTSMTNATNNEMVINDVLVIPRSRNVRG